MSASAVEVPGLVLEDELGRGGQSIVYRARRDDQACAVKIARRQGRGSRWFRREAAALARVRHPGVPKVLALGESNGRAYLVMELVEGESLADRLGRRPFTIDETIGLGRHLAAIIDAVHARGVVHRDIKPRNIIMEAPDRVRLVDFGLVSSLYAVLDSTELAGTPRYAAPEQMQAPHLVDARTDLFSIGRVLAECVERSGDTAPEGLHAIIAHLLSTSMSGRYPSALALDADLSRIANGDTPLGPSAFDPAVARRRSAALTLVGRDRVARDLSDRWACARAGTGGVVLIQGPGGAGKTVLVRAMTHAITQDPEVLLLEAEAGSLVPMAVVRRFVDALLDAVSRLPESDRRRREATIRSIAGERACSALAKLSPRLSRFLGDPPPAEVQHEAFAEVAADFLLDVTQAWGPTVMVIDDLQWIDPISREVLVRVALGASERALLFLAISRTDSRSLPALQRFGRALGRERLPVVDLSHVSSGDIERMVAGYLAVEDADPSLIRRVAGLGDGTPLGTLEVLYALIDGGALYPDWGSWRFDSVRAEQIQLPKNLSAVLERRVQGLPPATIRVLQSAAVMGKRFDPGLLGDALGLQADDCDIALAEAAAAGLVDVTTEGARFVHDTVRDVVLRRLTRATRAMIHQRIAECLDERTSHDPDRIFTIAHHFAEGEPERRPERTYRVAYEAASLAASRFDHETALQCFDLAERAATIGGISLDFAFLFKLAESRLAVGALDESLAALRLALTCAGDLDTVAALAKIAWVHQMKSEPEQAWTVLERAFIHLGHQMPRENPRSFADAVTQRLRNRIGQLRSRKLDEHDRHRLALACELHYQNARLGMEYEKPLRALLSALAIRQLGARLGPSVNLARAHAHHGAFMAVLGDRKRGRRALELSRSMAEELQEPAAVAHAIQLSFVVASWTGELDRALHLARQLLDDYGHWIEVSDYCLGAGSACWLESIRGRPREALAWLERSVRRVRRHGRVPAIYRHVIAPNVHSVSLVLGREPPPHLTAEPASEDQPGKAGLFQLSSSGSLALGFVEADRIGDELEEVIRGFESQRHNPRRVHMIGVMYYVAVAHARAMQCVRASRSELPARIAKLDRALADLRKAARIRLAKAHLRVLQAQRAALVDDRGRARRLLEQARTLAESETAPWVLGTIALVEARLLRDEGRADSAQDEARVAAMLAHAHGAVHRMRAICSEFDLVIDEVSHASAVRDPPEVEASQSSLERTQLRALVDFAHGDALGPDLPTQARAVLDELVRIVNAQRGLLLFERGGQDPVRLLVGRTREGDWSEIDAAHQALLKRVTDRGDLVAPSEDSFDTQSSSVLDLPRVIMPLRYQGEAVGALLLERDATDAPFAPEHVNLITTLAPQVPLALELTRVLEERDRLNEALRHAQKMEAIGQLASGIAHDFNNMLNAMFSAFSSLDRVSLAPQHADALSDVRESAQRASDLTRQLLAFARKQVLDMATLDAGTSLVELLPMLRRTLGEGYRLELERDDRPYPVRTDRTSLGQAIVNLVVNARDAMASGGTITIAVDEVEFDESWLAQGASQTGPHVRIEVRDTGTGMPPEIMRKVFEPFFTTKPAGTGTGLGLASLYGFVKQCGGHVDVRSEVGRGSRFMVYLPMTGTAITTPEPAFVPANAPARPHVAARPTVILFVDDEELVRRSTGKALVRAGFQVKFATNGAEALAIMQADHSIDIVVTDFQMPVMDGPSLIRRLRALEMGTPVIVTSGYADPVIADAEVRRRGVRFLQKPYSIERMTEIVHEMLGIRDARES